MHARMQVLRELFGLEDAPAAEAEQEGAAEPPAAEVRELPKRSRPAQQ
jgi:hypothetical protein